VTGGETAAGGSGGRREAVLLLGPTGSGKTPLGRILETRGLGRRCFHIDFGERLRRAAVDPGSAPSLSSAERGIILRVLETGALLEDGDFPIAEKILREFPAETAAGEDDLLVLNGLPRHAGQAERLASRIAIRAVVVLEAAPDTLTERIRLDAGREREGRADDAPSEIRAKLELFRSRTLPLVAYYENEGSAILTETVRPTDTGEALYDRLAARLIEALGEGRGKRSAGKARPD
jgi:adenylate kinase